MKNTGNRINHVVYGEFNQHLSRLSSEEIGKFYDNFVPVSVDVLPIKSGTSERNVLLGLRREEPRTWWTIGRGMAPGESPYETASRILRKEFGFYLGLEQLDRLKFLCINSSVFPLRRQPLEKNGRHCLVIVFSLEIKNNELLLPQTGKYRELKWFSVSEIISGDFASTIKAAVSCL
jgi:ADP-ribose pyrophosphatase YjhB (NUDIX family)